jgi:hypothetical protein
VSLIALKKGSPVEKLIIEAKPVVVSITIAELDEGEGTAIITQAQASQQLAAKHAPTVNMIQSFHNCSEHQINHQSTNFDHFCWGDDDDGGDDYDDDDDDDDEKLKRMRDDDDDKLKRMRNGDSQE